MPRCWNNRRRRSSTSSVVSVVMALPSELNSVCVRQTAFVRQLVSSCKKARVMRLGLFDQLMCSVQERWGYGEAQRLGGFEVYTEFKLLSIRSKLCAERTYSITSSARASSVGGTSRPIA